MLLVDDLEAARQRSAAVAKALADPKRLCVLQSLAERELSVRELSEYVGCHVPNMSQHLAVLRNSGLVLTRRDGNAIYYRIADPRILEACRLLQSIAGGPLAPVQTVPAQTATVRAVPAQTVR
ncbi:MAG TPA: metalloregulator ArsR/SmtB family transcription factor [Candidatus Limnocylindrales bacterium]